MAPDRIQEFVTTDDRRRFFDQVAQYGERLRPQIDRPVRTADRLLLSVDFKLVECNFQGAASQMWGGGSLSRDRAVAQPRTTDKWQELTGSARACQLSPHLSCAGRLRQVSRNFQRDFKFDAVACAIVRTECPRYCGPEKNTVPILNPREKASCEAAMLCPAVAILIGAFLLAWSALPLVQHASTRHSEPVRALVVESRTLPAASALDRIRPRHVFAYRYLYQGELYLGSVYRSGGGASEAVRRYGVGTTITAWVDPKQPESSVIENGPRGYDLALLALGLVLLIAGSIRYVRLELAGPQSHESDADSTPMRPATGDSKSTG